MNADLEAQLEEMGGAYRQVVKRLRSGRTVEPRSVSVIGRPVGVRSSLARVGWLVAASLFLAICLALFLERRPRVEPSDTVYTVAYVPTEAALAAIVASQRADGSWENDFITRQNAAALRHGTDGEVRIAYKRAVRFLRSRGLEPLSDEELRLRGAFAAERRPS